MSNELKELDYKDISEKLNKIKILLNKLSPFASIPSFPILNNNNNSICNYLHLSSSNPINISPEIFKKSYKN